MVRIVEACMIAEGYLHCRKERFIVKCEEEVEWRKK